MSNVFVLDAERRPLTPVHPGRARLLLTAGKAAVLRRYPFTIILMHVVRDAQPALPRLVITPGSRITGLALIDDATGGVIWEAEIVHRSHQIHHALIKRHAIRRGRRHRKTRYRPPRFANRCRRAGWLPPSIESRVQNVITWAERLRRLAPVTAISLEVPMANPKVVTGAKSPGCPHTAKRLGQGALSRRLAAMELPLATRACDRTTGHRLPNASREAAARETPSPERWQQMPMLRIVATGRHARQMCRMNAHGFPCTAPKATSVVRGLRTGDIVRAVVPQPLKTAGAHVGRIAVQSSGVCAIKTTCGAITRIRMRYCSLLQRNDGYAYSMGALRGKKTSH